MILSALIAILIFIGFIGAMILPGIFYDERNEYRKRDLEAQKIVNALCGITTGTNSSGSR